MPRECVRGVFVGFRRARPDQRRQESQCRFPSIRRRPPRSSRGPLEKCCRLSRPVRKTPREISTDNHNINLLVVLYRTLLYSTVLVAWDSWLQALTTKMNASSRIFACVKLGFFSAKEYCNVRVLCVWAESKSDRLIDWNFWTHTL